jgi:2-polyprenyl-3-methyl-5-hydroxy-6-metoxy-1,4-benzoquinol methylase
LNLSGREWKYYDTVRKDLIEIVPKMHGAILDVGCGAGATMMYLLDQGVAEATGVELSEDACEAAWGRNLMVIPADVQKEDLPFAVESFDFILFADILEHLYDPWAVLKKFSAYLKDDGTVLLSIPNVKHYRTLRKLLLYDEWSYQPAGVLDYTHIRFFTRKEAVKLVESAGLNIILLKYRTNRNTLFRLLHPLVGERVMTVWAEQFLIAAKKRAIPAAEG